MLRVASLVLLMLAAATGCARRAEKSLAGERSSPYETRELRYQGGSGIVSYPELAADLGYLEPIELRWVGNTISGPQDIQTVVTNDIEFGAAFNGSIIKLIEAKAPIRAVIGMSSVDDETLDRLLLARQQSSDHRWSDCRSRIPDLDRLAGA